MIELPRAALRAGEIAEDAEFFSFGTNDLTQTTLGLSRDDCGEVPARLRPARASSRGDPFAIARHRRRRRAGRDRRASAAARARPDLKLGICGEHGGDPGLDRGSASRSGSTTCPARPTACRSRASRRRRPPLAAERGTAEHRVTVHVTRQRGPADAAEGAAHRRQARDGDARWPGSRRAPADPRRWPCSMPPMPAPGAHVIGLTGPAGGRQVDPGLAR